ncbi:hypothetical protein Tco_1275110 [Tanacetum coccineum]
MVGTFSSNWLQLDPLSPRDSLSIQLGIKERKEGGIWVPSHRKKHHSSGSALRSKSLLDGYTTDRTESYTPEGQLVPHDPDL